MRNLLIVVLFTLVSVEFSIGRQKGFAPWLSDQEMLNMMLSRKVAPPENSPLTSAQVQAGKALWARLKPRERSIVMRAMRIAYVEGPYNRHKLTEIEFKHLLMRRLTPEGRQTMNHFLARLTPTEKGLIARMLLNCTTRYA